MKKNITRILSAFIVLGVVGLLSGRVAVGQQTPAPMNRTYVWFGELVSVDDAAKAVTVKVPFKAAVASYVGSFKPGEKIMVTWDMIETLEADAVLHVAKYEVSKGSKVDFGYILPGEFVSADASAKALTFKAMVPDNALASIKSVQPGNVIKVTSPMSQPTDTAMIASIEGTAGRPSLTPRPRPAPQAAKISTVDDYDKAMKAIGGAFGATNKAITSGAVNDAKPQLAIARSTMVAVEAFWVEKKKDDPAMLAKNALAKMDALEKTLSGGDTTAMAAAFKEVAGACGACHTKYREQDPTTKAFTMKAGTL